MSIISGLAVTGSGAAGYQIERSLRFRSAASAYLNRTPGTASNRKTWTWSGWVKRGALAGANPQALFSSASGTSDATWLEFGFRTADTFYVTTYNTLSSTTAVFRDPSAWYHVVVAFDTTQATSTNRIKIYINGTLFSTDNGFVPTLNDDYGINATQAHQIANNPTTSRYFDGYLTEINFVDGQALTPSDFGEYNDDTGVWQPIKYAGTYGTNGFYLNFKDNASTTTLGDDLSGNGNDWTTNNISLTAGATYDSMIDTPTPYDDGGNGRGNYCVLNPLRLYIGTPIDGNLGINASNGGAYGNFGVAIGKWYWETVYTSISTDEGSLIGIRSYEAINGGAEDAIGYWGGGSESGNKVVAGVASAYGAGWTTNDVMGIALDLDGGSITFYKNNVSQGAISFTPGGKSWASFNWRTGTPSGNNTFSMNYGQRPFTYTPPAGFKALNTQNLPEPTIVDGGEYFNTLTWSGDNTSPRAISGVGFQPDWVWIKCRSDSAGHVLFDAVRGTGKNLSSSSTSAEVTNSEFGYLSAFNSDGFSLTAGTFSGFESGNTNMTGRTYVGWNWKANGAGVSNTDGTITSTVSVNTTSGFSIVTYTGTGSAATVGHGLGAVPRMIIVKNRDAADAWQVYHAANTANPETDYLVLNTTAATADNANRWNDTLPTSTVFSIGNGVEVNTNTEDYVAYCFAPVAGYSAFGSYTGNGSADGPFVFCGFRPAFVLIKLSSGTDSWFVVDAARDPFNTTTQRLQPNSSGAESTNATDYAIDFTANGFKVRTDNGQINTSSGTLIYACFAENPFKNSLAR